MNNISIAFASGKGGTGKTSLAVNFAKYLSDENDVFLLDLDVEEPNINIYFKDIQNTAVFTDSMIDIPAVDTGKCVYCGECAESCNFNAIAVYGERISVFRELCKSCGRCIFTCEHGAIQFEKSVIGRINRYVDDRLQVIEGSLEIGDMHTKSLIADVKKHPVSGVRILDCPPGTTCPMVESVKDADFVVLVTEPTPFGLHDLSLAVDVAEKLGKKFGIVINKSGDNDGIIEKFCSDNSIDIIEKIPFSRNTAQKCGNGEFYHTDPEIRPRLQNIIRYITGAQL